MLAESLFGSMARHCSLGQLWFLWHLLVFVTVAPFVTKALGWMFLRRKPEFMDQLIGSSIRFDLAPLRPTPLVKLFGPASGGRPRRAGLPSEPAKSAGETHFIQRNDITDESQ